MLDYGKEQQITWRKQSAPVTVKIDSYKILILFVLVSSSIKSDYATIPQKRKRWTEQNKRQYK